MKPIVLLFMLSISLAPACKAAELSPKEVAAKYYRWVEKVGGGLPSEKLLTEPEEFLSRPLLALLHESLVAEGRCVKGTPAGLKPRIFEGNIFTGNYEGYSRIVSMKARVHRSTAVVEARMVYVESNQAADPHYWTDTLTLVAVKRQWLVSDVISQGQERSLAGALKRYSSKQECGI
jgi:hypothetical protein